MRISLNEIKKLVPKAAEVAPDELVQLVGSRLVEVEEKIDLAPKYQGVYIVKVVQCDPIPDTHLHLCKIDAGAMNVEFAGEDGLVQVVCGAPNVRKGMFTAWIAPGAIVPQTFGEENFKLEVKKLRGYKSYGMLAGIDELDLGDDHTGIVEIDPMSAGIPHDIMFSGIQINRCMVAPGDSFAEVFDLNDIILDIENKSLTHRPDTFGLIGFAREVAGILGEKFNGLPGLNLSGAAELSAPSSNVSISIEDAELCPRYSCAVLDLESPLEADKYLTSAAVFLAKAGMRTISKIVDVTNVLMLMTGQPLHAFDYDKFVAVGGTKDAKIIVRAAKDGEELQLLDGKTIKCTPSDILITSNNVPVALAGAMGGKSTEIDASTKKVILESATFSLYNLRKTQMAHGIFSEAITRFTKGQPASNTMPVLEAATRQIDGTLVCAADAYPGQSKNPVITVAVSDINSLLGTDYSKDLIEKTLANVGFAVSAADSADILSVTAPAWRTDIHIKEDIIEEVGRLLGYDNIALDSPMRPFIGAAANPLVALKTRLRTILSEQLGAHEILTYSFVSKKLQETVGEDIADSYKIVNSISPELQVFRQSLAPSILEKVYENKKAGFHDFALYEFNQIAKKSLGLDADGVPIPENHLTFVVCGDYYAAKAKLFAVLERLGFSVPAVAKYAGDFPYLEPLHSASLELANTVVGEVKSAVLRRLKIDGPVAVFDINLDKLQSELPTSSAKATQISRFPSVERDITVKVAADTEYAKVLSAISGATQREDLIFSVAPVSIYQSEQSATTKNLSFHLRFANTKKTLDGDEISAIMEEVANNVKNLVGAEIV